MTAPAPACPLPELGPEAYARWRASGTGAVTERLERELILELASTVKGQDVLDVGCGDGALAVVLHERGARVAGIDASPAMIAVARRNSQRHGADIAFAVADARRVPFPAERFDLVSAITILCFVADAAPVFREMARVLRPGGRLVIGELGKWSSWAAMRRTRAWLGSPLWRSARFRTASELRALAAGAGFATETVRGAIYYPRCAPAARLFAPCDLALGRVTTVGAAFLALAAVKRAGP